MSLFVSSLNSGSNGNCYYIGNENEAVLVDAGISCREIEKRMANLQLSMQKVKAIFISHEHSDHIKGLEVLARKFKLPVYISQSTLNNSRLIIDKELVFSFSENEPAIIGELSVTSFIKHHDAADPYSFVIEGNGVKVGVITDIGIACKQVIRHFKQCHAAFLESNYDEQMLDEGNYPSYLKYRIKSGKGHLSNSQALELFVNHRPAFMSHLFLSHLSKNNNCPDLVHRLFTQHAKQTNIIVASRYNESPVYAIRNLANTLSEKRKQVFKRKYEQMSLF